MSAPASRDPRNSGSLSDEELLHAHEQAVADKTDDRGSYKLLPLALLFVFSGLIFFGGTYLNLFSGHFDSKIFDERILPHKVDTTVKLDPVVYGQKLYESLCITCHQPTGLGVPGTFPPLAGSEWVNGTEERTIRIVMNGLKGPVTVKGNTFGTVPMPPVGPGGQNWTDDKIAAVLTYVRQAFGNTSGPITEERVAEIHAKITAHTDQWTSDELLKLP
ncbi:MAG TPA: cytochrome c [Opitutaceae bacterium]|nr:cytochrome c [Opitutaceae bacterium]